MIERVRHIEALRGYLGLERLDVIYAEEHTYPLAERVRAVALARLDEDLDPLF